jgi:hypothetical protein
MASRHEDCVGPGRDFAFLQLNASALSDPKSFSVLLTSDIVSDPFRGLVDSGSSHCFADPSFVKSNELSIVSIPPMPLKLIDGTVNTYVSEQVNIPTRFPTGEVLNLSYYVAPLESSYSVVLGLDWLRRHNPLIDWRLSSIKFQKAEKVETFPKSTDTFEVKMASASVPSKPIPKHTFAYTRTPEHATC